MRLLFPLLVAVAVLVGGERAFTASNTVTGARAGAGAGPISGYAIADVRYELAGDEIASVSFTLAPANAASVRVRLSPGGAWFDCAVGGGAATCPTPGTAVADASELQIVASS